jgi:GNAT superfamily N-acetyltransferase
MPAATCFRTVRNLEPSELRAVPDSNLAHLVRQPWTLRVEGRALLVRPSSARDLPGVAQMHARCSPRSLLDRYRCGGRPPGIAALDRTLRLPYSVVAVTVDGAVIASATLEPDQAHNNFCVQLGLLVEDGWQRLGIGSELASHLAGAAQLAGYHELIAYPATAMAAAQRVMIELGRTRFVPDTDAHLHTYLSDSATLGLGSVRQRLAAS